ncbi:PhzF family phenazine biosynthesis isomerase [Alteromonadaceae bacterium BrNp21-10]|nr:PhzF family phenazine biosynthesis isomerase [Alteromonadaceae bacterium BrNp21-10]
MGYKFYTADVFTTKPFNGAKIPVFPQAQGLSDHQMKLIANENNASDTIFVFDDEEPNTKDLRIFSATKREIKPSMHTLIAAAQVLTATKALPLEPSTPLHFRNGNDTYTVFVDEYQGAPGLITQSISTTAQIDRFVPTTDELAKMLTLIPADIGFDRHQPLIVSCDTPYLIIPIKSYNAVRAARFDIEQWSHSSVPASVSHGILLFSNNTDHNEADFHARLLGPDIANYDDPPVAPAMPHLANFLCQNPNIRNGTHVFSVQRGANDQRQSILHLEMDNKGEKQLTVRIGGSAVLMTEATMMV